MTVGEWQAVFDEWKKTFTFRIDCNIDTRVILVDYSHVLDCDGSSFSLKDTACGVINIIWGISSRKLFYDTRFFCPSYHIIFWHLFFFRLIWPTYYVAVKSDIDIFNIKLFTNPSQLHNFRGLTVVDLRAIDICKVRIMVLVYLYPI